METLPPPDNLVQGVIPLNDYKTFLHAAAFACGLMSYHCYTWWFQILPSRVLSFNLSCFKLNGNQFTFFSLKGRVQQNGEQMPFVGLFTPNPSDGMWAAGTTLAFSSHICSTGTSSEVFSSGACSSSFSVSSVFCSLWMLFPPSSS